MPATGMIDLHCDTLIRYGEDMEANRESLVGLKTQVSLYKMPKGTKWAQFYAINVPDRARGRAAIDFFDRYRECFDLQMENYREMVSPCRSFQDVKKAFDGGKFAAILTAEGGAVLAGDLGRVKTIAEQGVKSLTLTWNGPNEVCSGHDTDLGFSDFGKRAVPELEMYGIILDVSHLNDRGFDELCGMAEKPFIASHSNSRAICSHRRNLTDAQFGEIVRRKGLVGLNFYLNFVQDDGRFESLDDLYRHIDHFLSLGGEDVLCLGSDYDGADLPEFLNSVEKSLILYDYLVKKGLSEKLADKILFQNAYRFFEENL